MSNCEKTFIFTENPEAPACHASTVLPLPDGRVVTAWFAGEKEGAADVGIYSSVLANGVWSVPTLVTRDGGVPHWNPVLHLRGDGVIVLYYKYGETLAEWITKYLTSTDGVNWEEHGELVEGDTSGGRGPVKNKCIRLRDGRVVAPASTEPKAGSWITFVDISEDDGYTWEKQTPMESPQLDGDTVGIIQPSLWEDADGVHALMRSNKGAIYRSDSPDAKDWCVPYRTSLPNNNSGIDLDRDEDGRIWLCYNPVSENWGKRYPLVLAVSSDGGNTFREYACLEADEGEYSYPAVVAHDGKIYVTYTYTRKHIAFWTITP